MFESYGTSHRVLLIMAGSGGSARVVRGLSAAGALLVAVVALPLGAQQIVKCQDAEGRWHYGQYAAAACEGGAVRIDERGVRRGTVAVQPSPAELEAQRQAEALAEEEERRRAEQREAEERLLRIYESEDQIIRARDERLAAIDGEIALSEDFLQRLDARMLELERELQAPDVSDAARASIEGDIAHVENQIARFRDAISASLGQRRDVEQRYEEELAGYRAIMERRAARQDPG